MGSIYEILDRVGFRDQVDLVRAALVLGGAALAIGLARRRRGLLEAGAGMLVWSLAIFVSNEALIRLADIDTFESPRVPIFALAPLLGLGVLAVGAIWGALARRWRPWAALWLAGAAAAGLAVAQVSQAQLDRPVITPLHITPHCMPIYLSPADAVWLGGWWPLVALAGGLCAVLAQGLGRRIPGAALRWAGDLLFAGLLGLVGVATWRAAHLPEPQDYAASLPVVGTMVVDRPMTYEEMGYTPEILAREAKLFGRSSAEPRYDGHYAITGEAPEGITFRENGSELGWSWPGGQRNGMELVPAADRGLAIRRDPALGLWLVTAGDEAIANPDRARDEEPTVADTGWLLQNYRRLYLYWPLVAARLAPPRAWIGAAAAGLALSLPLRLTRAPTSEGQRTLAAMRIALLAALGMPLFVAWIMGFLGQG